ncbi:terminase small subunit [Erwinia sp. 9145]|uniref:terminase small subunit n=1 Tax=Erwinia sp. 9145 TaxID=1500895 RepID=UPI00069228AF|nr:terminase small subunit [Erwinia sp. 9145]
MAKPGWEAIEREYRAGDSSIRALAEKHGVSDTAIRKKAKSEGWVKPAKVRTNPAEEVRTANQNANLRTSAEEIIEDEDLAPMQAAFVLEYVKDRNGTQAAIRAGYSEDSASVTASRLLSKAKVRTAVNRQLQAAAERQLITADRVIAEMAAIGFSNFQDILDSRGDLTNVNDLPRQAAAAIKEIRVKVTTRGDDDIEETTYKLHDKRAALTELMKHLQLFGPEQEGGDTEPTPVQINVNVVDARNYDGDQPDA